jgi:hypothetical protein
LNARLISSLLCVGICSTICGALMGQSGNQSPGSKLRMADGRPNLSGVWVNTGFKKLANGMLERLPSANLPFKPGGSDQWNLKLTGDPHHDRPMFYARVTKEGDFGCRPPGMPQSALTANAQQLFQPSGYLLIVYEGIHSSRMIPMDGRPHPADLDPTYLGDSVGRYDGDVAVVDTTAVRPGMSDVGGHHMHSDAAHYIERYRRTGPSMMTLELTIDDPKVFTKPWVAGTWRMELHPEWTIMESNCEDGGLDDPDKQDFRLLDYLHHSK